MLWALGGFLVLKGIIIALIQIFCGLNTGLLVCVILGTLLEGIVSLLFDEKGNPVAKEIFYFTGLLLQIIPMVIATVAFFPLNEEDMNFIKAIALGWVCVIAAVGWFSNGFEGAVSFAYYYGVSIGILVLEGILTAFISLHTLLVVNAVISALAIVAVIIGRLKLGNNME